MHTQKHKRRTKMYALRNLMAMGAICTSMALLSSPLLAQVESKHPLASESAIRSTSISDLLGQAPRIAKSASALDKQAIAMAIEEAYASADGLAPKLTYQELQDIQTLYRYLRSGSDDRGAIVLAWLDGAKSTTTLSFNQNVWLLAQLETPEQLASAPQFKTSILKALSTEDSHQVPARDLGAAVRALAPHLTADEKIALAQDLGKRWATEIESKAPFNLTDAREASSLRIWQEIFDLLDDYQSTSSQYVEHLPAYLEKMTNTELYWRFRYEYVELLAQPIRSQAQRDMLLVAATEGDLRQDILRVLSSSFSQTSDAPAWHTQLDTLIKDTSLLDDLRAQWMIAKAYSVGLTDDTHKPSPLSGQQLLNSAMSLATTDSTRLACLQQMVLNNLAYFNFEQARHDVSRFSSLLDQASPSAIDEITNTISMVEHIVNQIEAIENMQ